LPDLPRGLHNLGDDHVVIERIQARGIVLPARDLDEVSVSHRNRWKCALAKLALDSTGQSR